MAAEHDAFQPRVVARHAAKLQPEIEARPLPRQKAELAAEYLPGQLLRVLGSRDGDDGVGVDVIDMLVRNEAVQRRVDGGRARIQAERAMVEQSHHLVLVREAAIGAFEPYELVLIERGEAVALHRAEIAAGALHPEHLDGSAGQRVLVRDLGRGVAAAEIGDAQIGAENVGAVEQQAGLVQTGRRGVVPKARQKGVMALT